jgi:hypothetical protein
MISTQQLMQTPSAQIIIPIQNEAHLMQMRYGHIFESPEPGIYLAGEVKPTIELNKNYFEMVTDGNNTKQLVLVKDINLVNGDLYDANSNIVVKSSIMKDKARLLRNEPTVPVRPYLVIMGMIKFYFDSIAPYKKYNSHADKILYHIKPEFHSTYNSGALEEIMVSIFQRLSDFIARDTWHIYFEDFIGVDIIIKKMCDYRVYDWHERMESEQWKTF